MHGASLERRFTTSSIVRLQPGVPVSIRLADVSLSLPELDGLTAQVTSPLRTGYGGGHGIDSMTLVHKRYNLSGEVVEFRTK